MKGDRKSGPLKGPKGKGKDKGKRSGGAGLPAPRPGGSSSSTSKPKGKGDGAGSPAPIGPKSGSFKNTRRPGADQFLKYETRWFVPSGKELRESHFFDREAALFMRPIARNGKPEDPWCRMPEEM